MMNLYPYPSFSRIYLEQHHEEEMKPFRRLRFELCLLSGLFLDEWRTPVEYGLAFPGGMVRERVVDGVSTKTYMLRDHDGNWQQVSYEVWDDARQQAAREQKG